MRPVIVWFRRDLRLDDHPALAAAAAAGVVVPLFVVDPTFDRSGPPRRAYLAAALRGLHGAVLAAGAPGLVCRWGDPIDVVPALAAEVGATAVYVSRDFGPYGRRRDAEVAARLRDAGAELRGVGSAYAVEPGRVRKPDGTAYAVFTPFARAWLAHGWPPPVDPVRGPWWPGMLPGLGELPQPPEVTCRLPPADPLVVEDRWHEFRDGPLDAYRDQRDLLGVDGTSRLSAALRWGVVHPRRLLADLGDSPGHLAFRNELAWREFYADVLFHRPDTSWRNLNPRMDAMQVDEDRDAFDRWAEGCTGYPVVDAGMRQLRAEGWMHNRARMVAGSFLVKDLHLPWQWGARHFMQHLVDGDLASNAHGWQWVAGTGTDAAPYFRVFNPTTQAARYDPDGRYVRRWVAELGGPGYPSPMVDHAVERDEALRRYEQAMAGSR